MEPLLEGRVLSIKIDDPVGENGDIREVIVTRTYADKEVPTWKDLLCLMQAYPKLVVDHSEQ